MGFVFYTIRSLSLYCPIQVYKIRCLALHDLKPKRFHHAYQVYIKIQCTHRLAF